MGWLVLGLIIFGVAMGVSSGGSSSSGGGGGGGSSSKNVPRGTHDGGFVCKGQDANGKNMWSSDTKKEH